MLAGASASAPLCSPLTAPTFLTVPTLIYPREAETESESLSPDVTTAGDASSVTGAAAARGGSSAGRSVASNLPLDDEEQQQQEPVEDLEQTIR